MTARLIKSFLMIGALSGLTVGLRADITVKGSDTLVILAQKWAELYMQDHPNTQIQVTGGGSRVGFAALQNQQTDLCNASRRIKATQIVARDKQVDSINRQLHQELSGYMVGHPNAITRCLNLMVVSKSFERIADHAANIAEEVVYLFDARDVRHTGANLHCTTSQRHDST